MRRTLPSLLIVTTAILALASTACGTKEPSSGEARLTLDGASRARARSVGSEWRAVGDGELLRPGTTLKVGRGEAGLSAHGRVELRLRAGGELVVAHQPELRAGALLVQTGEQPVVIRAAGSRFEVAAATAAKVTRSLAASTAVYHGQVVLGSAGRSLTVPALRTAAVPALGLVPSRPAPVAADPADPWDASFLGLAMDLAAQLEAGSNGFSAQVARLDDALLRSMLPDLPAGAATRHALGSRRPGEQLVAGAIATAAAPGGAAVERLAQALAFRDEGASWGLVTLDQRIGTPALVVGAVLDAIGRWAAITSPPAAAAPAPPAGSGRHGDPAEVGRPTTPVRVPTTTATPARPSPTSTTAPAVAVPELPATGTPVDDVVQTLRSALGAVDAGAATSGGA